MENKRKSIKRVLFTGTTVLVLVVSLLMGAFGLFSYVNTVLNKDKAYLRDILQLTMQYIDGDDLENCIETKQKSEKYEYAQNFLDKVKENYDDIEYIYIIKPLNANDTNNIMDVMAGITAEEKEEDFEFYSVELGKLNEDGYSAEVAGQYLKGMDADDITYFSNHTEFGYDYTGMVPIRNSNGESVALLAIDISMNEIAKVLMTYAIGTLVLIVLISLQAVNMVNKWLKNRVIDPVLRLEKVSEAFVESSHVAETPEDLVINDPDIHTGDEIESLSAAMSDMFVGMKNYMSSLLTVTKDKEKISAELNVATEIQASMLPRIFPAFPKREEFDLFASMDPALEVGGDFYDFFLIDEYHLALVVADVSGKGVPAALFMAISKTLIKDRAQGCLDPATILYNVNNQLSEGNDADLFVTVWLGILDLRSGDMHYTDAGHEYPLLIRADGKIDVVKPDKKKPPVATMEGISYVTSELHMDPGDTIFLYTDGVPEATNSSDTLYGMERLEQFMEANYSLPLEEMLPAVRKDVDVFVGDAPQFDDLTMLALRVNSFAK
ncbi:PP2C family protein-serine/threonine phosphatase [Pseudobutyrivibrio sp. MD2005]|uniref:PP2C family protein-serine/threonine phosphatase n=1 Tax=Pseudobutyrivibrio sp. MD2005 TaxID=1410616 RepID=UPI00068447C3|nr:PP2C family protein-serine/threonine phosphatase [Pseudobutyrivibrio sp. MD2005]